MATFIYIVHDCFCCTSAELSSSDEDHVVPKPKRAAIWSFIEKNSPIPGLDNSCIHVKSEHQALRSLPFILMLPTFLQHYCISSVQFSLSVMSDSLRPHESQHARPPCPSQTPRVYSNSCPSSR